MSEFLSAIPAAAGSRYALAAYAICAALFLLGGVKLRAVRAVLRQLTNVPESERRRVIEVVTESVVPDHITADQWIRHQRNRALFILSGTALILVAAVAVIARVGMDPDPPPPAEQAKAAALEWLSILDRGDYPASYAAMFVDFRERTLEGDWLQLSATYRKPLGAVERRIYARSEPSEFKLGRPLNGFTVMYYTKFANMPEPIRELVGLASPGLPEPWKVAGYSVDVPPNSPVLKADSSNNTLPEP